MVFSPKAIELKDGVTAVFRTPDGSDADKMLNYLIRSSGETDFLVRYPEERQTMTIEQEEAWIKQWRESTDTLPIACFINGELAGNCVINFGSGMKTSHRASVSIAVLKDYWNMGIGSAMFQEMIAAAIDRRTEIMELEFIEGNERAKHLYEKFGFRVVSEKPHALKLKDNSYQSEFYMQKYL